MKILKFVGLLVGMALIENLGFFGAGHYVRLGMMLNIGIVMFALWKMVND